MHFSVARPNSPRSSPTWLEPETSTLKNGVALTVPVSKLRIRIRPDVVGRCSTTNIRPESPGATVPKTGRLNPVATLVADIVVWLYADDTSINRVISALVPETKIRV